MSIWNFGDSPLLSSRALFLAEALLRGPDNILEDERMTPFCAQYGVYGAGLASFFGGFEGAFGICMLMDERLVGGPLFEDVFPSGESDTSVMTVVRTVPLTEVANALKLMQVLFGNLFASPELDWLKSVAILAVPEPKLNLAPGDQITASLAGLAGAPVTWGSVNAGFLTAGHVGAKGAVVSDASGPVGTIVFSSDPVNKGGAISPDVAVVELASGTSLGTPPAVSGLIHPAPAADVDIHTQKGVQTISLMGETPYLNVPNHGMFGDMYWTVSGVTQGGDSGGPVFEHGGSGLIGHVVGSSGGATSYFQDVAYQLREIRQDPVFATIRI